MTIGGRIAQKRKEMGLSQEALGEKLCVAALVTDNFGRQFMAFDIPCVVEYDEKGRGELTYADEFNYSTDLADWVLVTGEVQHTATPIGKP